MKGFNLIPREYLKLLLELVVIFISVVLAFFFDDYRENRSQREQYKADLSAFRADLMSVIGDMYTHLDSFRVADDTPHRGKRLKDLANLLWLDSLADLRKATMSDFRYIIENGSLEHYGGSWKISPLANEIRLKYSAQSVGGNVLALLSEYLEEMTDQQQTNLEETEENKKLLAFIHKTSPDLQFNKQDSIFLYSNEVRWSFKRVIDIKRDLYGSGKWLAVNVLKNIAMGINRELSTLGVENTWGLDCFGPPRDFKKRFACEQGKSITDEDLFKIMDDVVSERNAYLSKLQK